MSKDKTVQKYAFDGLYLELTRRCNLRCAHCLCGAPENTTISKEIIDEFLSQVTAIKHLMIGGGEPLLELDTFEYLLDALERHSVPVFILRKKFPTANLEVLQELSMLQTIYGALNQMTVDEYKLALFKGNPAEVYFKTITQRLKKHGMSIRDYDPCAKIPDTFDLDEEGDTNADPNEELQPNAAG